MLFMKGFVVFAVLAGGLLGACEDTAKKREENEREIKRSLVQDNVRRLQQEADAKYVAAGSDWNNGTHCPTLADLGYLGASPYVHDVWGNTYAVTCSQGHVRVASPGPDGQLGSADDVVAP